MDVRPSPIAGLWYPGEAAALRDEVEAFLDAAQPVPGPPPNQVVGLLAPHAGHRYSGAVAAYAFRAVRGAAFDSVVVVCPSHFHADGPVLTSAHAAYATPLGVVPVDRDTIDRLRAEMDSLLGLPGEEAVVALRCDREHALEIELPFLQRVLAPGFRLVPVMLRDQGEPVARALGEALAAVLAGRRALLVASSDLSHFFPQALAQALDAEMLRQVESGDPEAVLQAQADGRGQACGVGVIAAVLWAARALGATLVQVVRHATSGDVSGDYEQVVGYGAAVIYEN